MLSESQLQNYANDGFLNALTIHSDGEVGEVRRQFDELETREGKEHCQIGLQGRHVDQKLLWDLATTPTILDCMEAILGPDVMLLSTHVFCKYPENNPTKFVAWHQDVTYWGLEPPEATTAWYAIDDADAENGCMQVLPGTHRSGITEHGTSDRAGNLLSINQEISTELDESTKVDLAMKAGQISIHDGYLVHGSAPNRSNRRRCGVTIRYCRPNVKPVRENSVKKPWPAIIVRGKDRFNHFDKVDLQH